MFEKKPRLRSHEDRYLSQLIFGKALNEEDIDPVLIPCVTREDFDVYDYFRMWSSFPTLDRPGPRLSFCFAMSAILAHLLWGSVA